MAWPSLPSRNERFCWSEAPDSGPPSAPISRPSLQNGWGNGDVLASVYPAEQVVVGVTYNSGTVLDIGRVAHPGVGPTTVGSFEDGGNGRPEQLAGALGDAGFEVRAVPLVHDERPVGAEGFLARRPR